MNKSLQRQRILFDLEATCWEDKEFQEKNSEIIEIGAVKFDCKSFDILDEFQTFVKPVVQQVLSDYCTNLTHITQKQVKNAPRFPEAYRNFMSWADTCPLFIGWGEVDWRELNLNCYRWNNLKIGDEVICFPQRKYLNGKQLYTYFTGIRGSGLKKRLDTDKIKFQGTQHRALDDAKMTLQLLRKAWFDF